METENSLRILLDEEVPFYTKMAEKFLPQSIAIYGFLSTGFKYKTINEKLTKMYVPKKKDSPFFAAIIGCFPTDIAPSLCVHWKVGSISKTVIADYLHSLPEMNWKYPVFLAACEESVLNELECILSEESFYGNVLKRNTVALCGSYMMKDNENVPNFVLPEDFELGEILEKDGEKVYENWGGNIIESVENITAMITHLPSSAIFYQPQGNSTKEMVAWTLLKHSGDIGMTHTLPNFRKNGFATIVTCDLVKKQQKLGFLPNMMVEDVNLASIDMHLKMGFAKRSTFGWELYQNPDEEVIKLENLPDRHVNFII